MTASILNILAQVATTRPSAVNDDFAPGLLIAVLFIIGICLLLIGIGIVVAVVAAVAAAALIGLGVVSSSALVAIASRRWSAGFRALVYQALMICAAPCGILLVWLAARVFHVHLTHREIVAIGFATGIAAGLSLAFALDGIARFVVTFWLNRQPALRPGEVGGPDLAGAGPPIHAPPAGPPGDGLRSG